MLDSGLGRAPRRPFIGACVLDDRHPATRPKHRRRARPHARRLPGPDPRRRAHARPASGTSPSSSPAPWSSPCRPRSSSRRNRCRSPARPSACCVVGGALGFRRGALALLLYLAFGRARAVGLRARATSGVARIVGATGGYLIGFVVGGRDRRPAGRARLGPPHRRVARGHGHRHRGDLRDRRPVAEGLAAVSRGRRRSPGG